jgi:3-oxoacyl-[acyl-carrier protein] reductase
MLPEFKGKTALVTGASRGIGAATAVTLAENGCSRVVIHYNSHAAGAEQVLRAIRDAGADTAAMQADLSTPAGIRSLREQMRTVTPEVDLLINNAGSLVQRALLADFTEDLFDRVMDLNFRSAWFLSQEAAPSMARKGWGVVVNLSSIAARHGGGPGAAIYSASKAAVACITKGLAKELAPKGIRVNAVSPGTVDNDFHRKFSTAEMLEAMRKTAPAGRLGDNQEVADTILFLCSDKARYIVGQTIEVNGGMFMV